MAKSPKKLAEEIKARMQRGGKNVMTIRWPEFYEMAEIERWRDERAQLVRTECLASGVAIGWGNNVVICCLDADVAP